MATRGNVKYHPNWRLTDKRQKALQRLAELRVRIRSDFKGHDFTVLIPQDLLAPEYLEIGYLLAQLGDEEFPERYQCLSEHDDDSAVFPPDRTLAPPVTFIESYPHELKYRITLGGAILFMNRAYADVTAMPPAIRQAYARFQHRLEREHTLYQQWHSGQLTDAQYAAAKARLLTDDAGGQPGAGAQTLGGRPD